MNELRLRSVFHGRVDVDPMMAKVIIAAAGAIAVKKLAWINLDPFLRARLDKLLKFWENMSTHPPLLFYKPYFLSLSIIAGVLMLK